MYLILSGEPHNFWGERTMILKKTRIARGEKLDYINKTSKLEYHVLKAKNWDGNLFLQHHFNRIEFNDCNLSECMFVSCVFEDCLFTNSCLDESLFINCELINTARPFSDFLHRDKINSTIGLNTDPQNSLIYPCNELFLPINPEVYSNSIIQPMRKLNINTYFAKIKDKANIKFPKVTGK